MDKTYTNSLGMEFVLIPAGSYLMEHDPDEVSEPLKISTYGDISIYESTSSGVNRTRHKITVSKPFYLGKYPVTQAQWEMVMGDNPSFFRVEPKERPGDNPIERLSCDEPDPEQWAEAFQVLLDKLGYLEYILSLETPVERVSWYDAQEFIRRLNAREGHFRYRLPTDAEWELAARGGTDTAYFFTKDPWPNPEEMEETIRLLAEYAWFGENSQGATRPVGQKKPNPYGLHDIYGNVWEWTRDWYGELPKREELVDFRGPDSGEFRLIRGGGWGDDFEFCRSDLRRCFWPENREDYIGFRLALSP